MIDKPTAEQFKSYQELYDYFNKGLFGGQLPQILLNFSRKANSCGFFAAERWKKEKDKTHEISINPAYLSQAPFREVCQTLVHEMCHLWQFAFGKPSRTCYHNKEWAHKMEDIGLMPSDTGEPGGARIG
jgi:predicted SprT family Zn-dependent metalloprotease